jgi:hypothetical protein
MTKLGVSRVEVSTLDIERQKLDLSGGPRSEVMTGLKRTQIETTFSVQK